MKSKIFLMDEPLSNLDAKSSMHTRAEFKRLQKQHSVRNDESARAVLSIALLMGFLDMQVS